MRLRGGLRGFFPVVSVVFILAFLAFFNSVFAGTTVTSPEQCVRIVTLKIEIYSDTEPYVWTDDQLDDMDAETREWAEELMSSHTSYGRGMLNKVASDWKSEIEAGWNGPTQEQVAEAAEELGVSDEDLENASRGGNDALRDRLDKKAREMMDAAGQTSENCAEVNCCKIFFKVDVKVRDDDDEPTEGYNQVEVMTKGYRSNVSQHADGIGANQQGTTGRWAYDPKNPRDASAAHESGHLMGLDDKYSDNEEGVSEPHDGHEDDMMGTIAGWPRADGIDQILKLAGAECDCCPRTFLSDAYATGYNMNMVFANDAIAGNNCEYLKQALAALERDLRNLRLMRIPISEKMNMATRLQEKISQVKKALEDCPKETATTTGIFIPEAPFTFDSNICQFYGGGTIDLPVTPFGPFVPTGPETPGTTPPTTPTTPGTPPSGPTEIPGTTPPFGPLTPKIPGGGYNPDLIFPFPIDTVVPGETPGGDPGKTETPSENIDLEVPGNPPVTVTIPRDDDDDETTPPAPIFIVKAEQTVLEGGQTKIEPVEGAVLKLGFPPPQLPTTNTVRTAEATDEQHDQEPRHVVTDENGIGTIFADGFESGDTSAWSMGADQPRSGPAVTGAKVDLTPTKSSIVYVGIGDDPFGGTPVQPQTDPAGATPTGPETRDQATGALPEEIQPFVTDGIKFGNTWGLTLSYKYNDEDFILGNLEDYQVEENHYRDKQADDPYYNSKGSWNQDYDDQWAIKRVGFTEGEGGAWSAAGENLNPVVVAVIDTGLDWNHADISWDNIWQNEDEIPDNGIDDDLNGYIDDMIGWDFYANTNKPWDQDGHGTFIAGMIAAATDNGIGIAGMNPAARIMVLKALNDFGHSRASFLAKAIKYAADNGADVINLSVGGKHLTRLEKMAVEYAFNKGVVVVVAAGNDGSAVSDYGLSPYEEVITVGSTDLEDNRAIFSNWGAEVDIAAPGLDVMSLRARRTDFMRHIRNVQYEEGSAYVGEDKRYYRSSGTSFSAPVVSGVASLILSKNPGLSNVEVKRMILNSAKDIETPGRDQYTGYGLVNATAALRADPAFEILADISGVEVVQRQGQTFVAVKGAASANEFQSAEISIGPGENPEAFKPVGERIMNPAFGGTLALIPAEEFRAAPVWIIRLVVTHSNGQTREERFVLNLG